MKLVGLIFLALPLLVAGQSNKGISFKALKPTLISFQQETSLWNSSLSYPINSQELFKGKVGNYTGIETSTLAFDTLVDRPFKSMRTNYFLTMAWKHAKKNKITAGIGIKQDYHSISENGGLRFTDGIDPEKGFVAPSSFQLVEQRFYLYSISEQIGYTITQPIRKMNLEFENGIRTSQLIKAKTSLELVNASRGINLNYLYHSDLALNELKRWQFSIYNSIRLAIDINPKYQIALGLTNQIFFNNINNKKTSYYYREEYFKGYAQLNLQLAIRYYIDTM